MPKLLVFQHVPFEILGTLDPLLRSYGFRVRYVNFGRQPDARPRLNSYHGLVVLGGPMNVDQVDRHPHLSTEIELIREAIERQIPVLGICLGAQLIARALGAEVRANSQKEIGWYDVDLTDEGRSDPLLCHFAPREKLFQWHGDAFDLPRGAVHLAKSTGCDKQAFRVGDRVYGFQFHLEVDEPLIHRWLGVPIHAAELVRLKGVIDPEEIRRQTSECVGRLKQLSNDTFGEWVKLFGDVRRRAPHPHR
jgi:GMP synthase (glutamine-hydrolysing)